MTATELLHLRWQIPAKEKFGGQLLVERSKTSVGKYWQRMSNFKQKII